MKKEITNLAYSIVVVASLVLMFFVVFGLIDGAVEAFL